MPDGPDTADPEPWWEAADIDVDARRTARSIEEILNQGDVDAVEDYHREDLDYFRSSDEHLGRQALKEDVRMFLSAFPDLEAQVDEAFADGDGTVTVRYTVTGTHAGTFENIPPTDQRVTASGIGIAVYEGDRIGWFSLVFDNLGMLQDLGLLE